MAKAKKDVVANENVEAVVADNVITDITIPQEEPVEAVFVQSEEAPAQEQPIALDDIPEHQAIALLEQGAFDYYIQGVDAVLNSPYTEGSAENVFYTRGWNKAFDEANKA